MEPVYWTCQRGRILWHCINYSAPDRGAEYRDEHVCLSVCVCVHALVCPGSYLRNYVPSSPNFFTRATYGRGLVLLWRHNDMLCTSGFMDDVIFAHKPRLLDLTAQLKRSS